VVVVVLKGSHLWIEIVCRSTGEARRPWRLSSTIREWIGHFAVG
jgi:hypothetical protein